MPRERLVYERHKSRPVHVSVSGRNRAVPQPYTINLIHVHCGRRTERGRRKYSSRSVARGGFFIPFHGTIPLHLSKRNFKSPGWKNLFGQTVHSDYFPIIFPRPPTNSSSFVFSIARSWVLIFTCWSFSYFHFYGELFFLFSSFFFSDRSWREDILFWLG